MFATPDFGLSDLWQQLFANKFILSEALKDGYFPFWSKDIGTGFPLFAESQIGMFNLYNLIAFKFLPAVDAFNLGYLVIFLTTFTGTFFFCRLLNFKKLTSLLAALFFSLSGIFVTHVPHFNFIQTACFLPWVFYLTEKLIQTKQIRFGLLIAIVFSQQIYTGYPQMALITVMGSTLYCLWRAVETKSYKVFIIYDLFVLLGAAIASPQLAMTLQLVRNSPGLLETTYSSFPFPPIHFLGFFHPYIFGDPRIGTYPHFGPDWGIFWESTGYFGGLAFILALAAFFVRKKTGIQKIFIIVAIISAILTLGKYTPFFFIEKIPPLDSFRVPARYLLLFTWAMVILSASIIDKIKIKPILYIFAAISTVELLLFSLTYNPTISGSKFLEPPETARFLNSHDKSWFRTHSIPAQNHWNQIFMTKGWSNVEDFLPFKNSLDGNMNVYWGISSLDVYARLIPARQLQWKILIGRETNHQFDNTIFLSPNGKKVLSLAGVKYIISPGPIANSQELGFKKIFTTGSQPVFYIYEHPNPLPHSYLTRNYMVTPRGSARRSQLVSSPSNLATVLEEDPKITVDNDPITKANVLKNSDLEVVIEATAPKKSLLVLSDTFYPGWQATIDGKPTRIYAANINQRAVLVDVGSHQIVFKYNPFHNLTSAKMANK